MDLRNEVDYRISKWIVLNMQEAGFLTKDEVKAIWQQLLDQYDPPFRSTETVTGKIREDTYGSCT